MQVSHPVPVLYLALLMAAIRAYAARLGKKSGMQTLLHPTVCAHHSENSMHARLFLVKAAVGLPGSRRKLCGALGRTTCKTSGI